MADIVKIELTEHEKFAIYIADLYANDIDFVIQRIVNSLPFRMCIWDCYKELNISIPQDALPEVWQRSFLWQPLEIQDHIRMGICKCIYFLNHIFETYF
jgi:hypothetical protein